MEACFGCFLYSFAVAFAVNIAVDAMRIPVKPLQRAETCDAQWKRQWVQLLVFWAILFPLTDHDVFLPVLKIESFSLEPHSGEVASVSCAVHVSPVSSLATNIASLINCSLGAALSSAFVLAPFFLSFCLPLLHSKPKLPETRDVSHLTWTSVTKGGRLKIRNEEELEKEDEADLSRRGDRSSASMQRRLLPLKNQIWCEV